MLELAAERAGGSITYFVTPEHTAFARERLGPDAFLAVEQAVVLEDDPARAREIARPFVAFYTGADNYRRMLLRLGWTLNRSSTRGQGPARSTRSSSTATRRRSPPASARTSRPAPTTSPVQALPNDDPQRGQLRRLAPALVSL